MIKKLSEIIEFCEGIPATVVSGIFLILSLILPEIGITAPVSPACVTVIISGLPLFYSAIRKLIKNRGIEKISSSLLISIAMSASIAVGDLFAAAEIAFIMAIGEILEDLTTDRAKKGLKSLISIVPTRGRRITDGKEESIGAEKIRKDDILRILPGEAIPVDGVIIAGETSVDQSVITGESLPVDKSVGDDVFCGTINRFGSVDIKATRVGEDSSLQKLIQLVEQAGKNKAPIAKLIDKFAIRLVPTALLIAVITGILTRDIVRAVTVLVVFCPCALVLATPTAVMAAIGQATKHGVIIKSGNALEKMGIADTIAFDKTGTLTYGELQVSDIIPFDSSLDENALLTIAATAEAKSEHPLGKAITVYAKSKSIHIPQSTDFKMTAGKGVEITIGEKRILCGNESFAEEKGIALTEAHREVIEKLRLQGKACVIVIIDTHAAGIIALSDTLRSEAHKTIAELNKLNIQTLLLTGDNINTARYFAQKASIKEIKAGLLPDEKSQYIKELQKAKHSVCMVGDGVNDAPALKAADVGIAMGSMGSDIAVDSADIALMSDDIGKLPYLKRLSIAAVKTIKISIALSMVINILAVILSVMGVLTPTTGALVHNAGSVLVVLFAAMLYERKFK